MIGYRLWCPSAKVKSNREIVVGLHSALSPYEWTTPTVTNNVDFLVNPYKENTAGYQISLKRYMSQDDVEDVLPLTLDSDDPFWSDREAWHKKYYDYIVWEWNSTDNMASPYYGFYAMTDFDAITNHYLVDELPPTISGVVTGYDMIHKHKNGFRSQSMSIHSFFINDVDLDICSINCVDENQQIASRISLEEYAERLSFKMNIPLVTMSEAKEIGLQYV